MKILAKLILHMDDESEPFRKIVFGCIVTLPSTLDQPVMEAVEKARGKQIYKDLLAKTIEKISALHV